MVIPRVQSILTFASLVVLLSACGEDPPSGDGGTRADTGGTVFTCPDPRGCPSGCCDGTSCLGGDTLLSCGIDGDTCRPCMDGGECIDGACRPAICEAGCEGCCAATGCQPGTAPTACGGAGGSCIECIAGERCNEGACECVPECADHICGPDGCGGECGAGCPAAEVCNAEGTGCAPPACTSCADCTDEEACLFGRCQSPWGQTYRVVVHEGTFPERTSDGTCWDTTLGLGCDLPDPTVMVSTDESSWRTGCTEDTLHPVWEGSVDLVIGRSDALYIRLVDEDVGGSLGCDGFTNDPGCSFHFAGPDHPDAVPMSTESLRNIICTSSFEDSLEAVCDPGFAVTFSMEAIWRGAPSTATRRRRMAQSACVG